MAGKVEKIKIVSQIDESPDLSWLEDESRYKGESPEDVEKYTQQDKERLESYGDQWYMIGIWAEAEVNIGGTIQNIRSGGLWGIESDSDRDYLKSIAKEEYDNLKGVLKDMGIKKVPSFDSAEFVEK